MQPVQLTFLVSSSDYNHLTMHIHMYMCNNMYQEVAFGHVISMKNWAGTWGWNGKAECTYVVLNVRVFCGSVLLSKVAIFLNTLVYTYMTVRRKSSPG